MPILTSLQHTSALNSMLLIDTSLYFLCHRRHHFVPVFLRRISQDIRPQDHRTHMLIATEKTERAVPSTSLRCRLHGWQPIIFYFSASSLSLNTKEAYQSSSSPCIIRHPIAVKLLSATPLILPTQILSVVMAMKCRRAGLRRLPSRFHLGRIAAWFGCKSSPV